MIIMFWRRALDRCTFSTSCRACLHDLCVLLTVSGVLSLLWSPWRFKVSSCWERHHHDRYTTLWARRIIIIEYAQCHCVHGQWHRHCHRPATSITSWPPAIRYRLGFDVQPTGGSAALDMCIDSVLAIDIFVSFNTCPSRLTNLDSWRRSYNNIIVHSH